MATRILSLLLKSHWSKIVTWSSLKIGQTKTFIYHFGYFKVILYMFVSFRYFKKSLHIYFCFIYKFCFVLKLPEWSYEVRMKIREADLLSQYCYCTILVKCFNLSVPETKLLLLESFKLDTYNQRKLGASSMIPRFYK